MPPAATTPPPPYRLIEDRTPEGVAAWNKLVDSSPQSTIFHATAWREAFEAGIAPATSPSPATARSIPRLAHLRLVHATTGETAAGLVALIRRRHGASQLSLPLLTPYAGYLLAPTDAEKLSGAASHATERLQALAALLRNRPSIDVTDDAAQWVPNLPPDLEDYTCSPALADPRPLIQSGYKVTPRFTYHIDLTQSPETLWSRLDGSTRRQVQKAEKADYAHHRELTPDHLPAAYALLAGTFAKRNQASPVTCDLFESIATHPALSPHRESHVLLTPEGQLASYIILLSHQGTLSYAIAATHHDHLSAGASSLLTWTAIKSHAGDHDPTAHTFDFVGANLPTIARFKEGFNPTLATYWRLQRATTRWGRALQLLKP